MANQEDYNPSPGHDHVAPPSNPSLVTKHGGVDVSGVPPVDSSGLPASRTIGHEEYEVGLRGIFNFFLWFGIALAVAMIASYVVLFAFKDAEEAGDLPKVHPTLANDKETVVPEPRLQPSRGHETMEQQDIDALKRSGQMKLTTYGWVDETAGVAHIPIDVAMKMAADTLPARAGGKAPPAVIPSPPIALPVEMKAAKAAHH
jgi:hypothetical protein